MCHGWAHTSSGAQSCRVLPKPSYFILVVFFFKYSFSYDFGGFVRLCFAVIGTFINVLHSATADR